MTLTFREAAENWLSRDFGHQLVSEVIGQLQFDTGNSGAS
jgi:hypothetical protein